MKNKRSLAWLISFLMTAALFAVVALFMDVRFGNNDDAAILKAFLGYESGTPSTYNLYIHGLLAWPLGMLGRLVPGVNWFSWMQLALMFVSLTVIGKSLMQLCAQHHKPLWFGAALALVFDIAFGVEYVTRFTFTMTAAFLGAAAVMQLLSIPRGGRVVGKMLGAGALACLAYAMRQVVILPVLGFCGLVFLWMLPNQRKKQMVAALVLVAVMIGGMVGWRAAETARSGYADYIRWDTARSAVVDYHNLFDLTPDEREALGLSDAAINLAAKWCFLDSDFSTEALEQMLPMLASRDAATMGDKLQKSFSLLSELMQKQTYAFALACLGLVLMLMCALLTRERWNWLLISLSSLAAVAMVIAVGAEGRLPMRAVLQAGLLLAALGLGLLIIAMPRKGMPVTAALLAVCVLVCALPILQPLVRNAELDLALGSAMGDLEEYALSDEECLFLYDDTLSGADTRAFPDYAEGMPTNISSWGGWTMRSPESKAQFERFGIDLDDFDPNSFLDGTVYLASGRIDPPPTALIDWLNEKLGGGVECELYSEWGSVYIFQFVQY